MNAQLIPISQIETNTGQIEGLPKNPRFIRDDRFKKLVTSIQEDPEMLALREVLVYPYQGKFIAIGGNMRLRACKELRHKDVPCKVLPADTSAEKLRAYAIKDNVGYGQDDTDLLANEWDLDELRQWGVDLPDWNIQTESADAPDYSGANKEVDIDLLDELMEFKFKVSKEDYFDFQERLNVVCARQNVNTKEEALRELLNFYERHAA